MSLKHETASSQHDPFLFALDVVLLLALPILIDLLRAFLKRLRRRLCLVRMDAVMCWVIKLALHREYTSAIGAQYHMIDLPESTDFAFEGHCCRCVLPLLVVAEAAGR